MTLDTPIHLVLSLSMRWDW